MATQKAYAGFADNFSIRSQLKEAAESYKILLLNLCLKSKMRQVSLLLYIIVCYCSNGFYFLSGFESFLECKFNKHKVVSENVRVQ